MEEDGTVFHGLKHLKLHSLRLRWRYLHRDAPTDVRSILDKSYDCRRLERIWSVTARVWTRNFGGKKNYNKVIDMLPD